MYEFINKLRLSRQLTFDEGQITLLGKPTVMMIPADTFIALEKEYLKNNPIGLYRIGRDAGKDFYRLVAHFALDAPHIIKFGVQVFNTSGFGKLEVIRVDYKNSRAIFHIRDSISARIKSKDPVCHYIRGLLASFIQESLKKEIEGVETNCIAQGHQICEFILKRKGEFDKNSELVKKQLGI